MKKVEQALRSRSLTVFVPNFRPSSRAWTAIIALMLVSWFTTSNHCALGLMARVELARAEHSRCCNDQPDSNQKVPRNGMVECCKSLVATVSSGAEAGLVSPDLLARLDLQTEIALVLAGHFRLAIERDHGPPRLLSFAEAVLQRSLLSHAPPFAV